MRTQFLCDSRRRPVLSRIHQVGLFDLCGEVDFVLFPNWKERSIALRLTELPVQRLLTSQQQDPNTRQSRVCNY